MAIISKSWIHDRSKVEGASGDAAGILPEDVQDYILANGGTIDDTSQMNKTMCPLGSQRILTLLVMDDNT